jgi:hypothetical protein
MGKIAQRIMKKGRGTGDEKSTDAINRVSTTSPLFSSRPLSFGTFVSRQLRSKLEYFYIKNKFTHE